MSDWQEDKNSPGAEVKEETGVLEKAQQQEEEDRVVEEKEEGVLLQEEDRNKMVQMFNKKGKIIGQHTRKYSPAAVFSPSLHARSHIFL